MPCPDCVLTVGSWESKLISMLCFSFCIWKIGLRIVYLTGLLWIKKKKKIPVQTLTLSRRSYQSVNPKGNQPWIFIGRSDAEAEAPVIWSLCAKSCLIGNGTDAGKDWGQEEKGVAEDEMVGWHHWLNGHEFEQTPGDSRGQRSLACRSLWGRRVGHDLGTERWRELQQLLLCLMAEARACSASCRVKNFLWIRDLTL